MNSQISDVDGVLGGKNMSADESEDAAMPANDDEGVADIRKIIADYDAARKDASISSQPARACPFRLNA